MSVGKEDGKGELGVVGAQLARREQVCNLFLCEFFST